MAIVLIIIGAAFLVAAVRWDSGGKDIWTLIENDFTSDQNGSFISWAAAIILIGALGYIEDLKPIANSMLALIIVVLLLSNRGFFANLQRDITAQAPQVAQGGQK